MTAATISDPAGQAGPAEVTLWLDQILADLGGLAYDTDATGDAARIDRIAVAEKIKAALDAVQANEIVAFAKSQVAEQQRLDVDPSKVGRDIGDQIGLACKVSPTEGSRRLHVARDLVLDMPNSRRDGSPTPPTRTVPPTAAAKPGRIAGSRSARRRTR